MLAKKYKVRNIGYSYHPNFVQDDNEACGYRLTGGGKYIVEWDTKAYHPYPMFNSYTHHAREFNTEVLAQRFEIKLRRGLDPNDCVTIDENNAYLIGSQ